MGKNFANLMMLSELVELHRSTSPKNLLHRDTGTKAFTKLRNGIYSEVALVRNYDKLKNEDSLKKYLKNEDDLKIKMSSEMNVGNRSELW